MSDTPESGDANEEELSAWLFEELAGEEALEEDMARSQALLARMAAQLNADPTGPSTPPGLDEDAWLERYVEEEESGMPHSPAVGAPFPSSGATAGIDLEDAEGLDDLDLTDFADF